MRGHRHDGSSPRPADFLSANGGGGGQAVKIVHFNVHENQIKLLALPEFDCLAPELAVFASVPTQFEQADGHFLVYQAIVGNQDMQLLQCVFDRTAKNCRAATASVVQLRLRPST